MHLRAALATADLLHAGWRLATPHYRASVPVVLEGLACPLLPLTHISARRVRKLASTRSWLTDFSSCRSRTAGSQRVPRGADRIVDELGTARCCSPKHAPTAADARLPLSRPLPGNRG